MLLGFSPCPSKKLRVEATLKITVRKAILKIVAILHVNLVNPANAFMFPGRKVATR